MARRHLVLVILLIAIWPAGRCWAETAHKTSLRTRTGAGLTAQEDKAVEADIRARFARSKINEDRFTVRVQGGIATLEGRTGVIQHKGVATRLAKSGGARAVVNRIEITEAARQKAASRLAEGRRRAQIKRSEPRSERR